MEGILRITGKTKMEFENDKKKTTYNQPEKSTAGHCRNFAKSIDRKQAKHNGTGTDYLLVTVIFTNINQWPGNTQYW